ncbi:MAG TPA: membrane protein insertase YidC, partial [Croceibacterium sp.]|nr:membrane protein insertase YidC [Croceibacterium sp.]
MDNQRNLIFAVVLCGLLLFGWDFVVGRIYPAPAETEVSVTKAATEHPKVKRTREGGLTEAADIAEEARDLNTALATAGRVPIDAPDIAGSINPVGARIDDVSLKDHRQAIEQSSGPVRLFSPSGTPAQQFAQFGWAGDGIKLPDARTVWTAQGTRLTPQTPVLLTWDNGEGQRFSIRFTIDDKYMITAEQAVANIGANAGAGPIVVRPYAFLNRTSRTASLDSWNVHSGPIGSFDGAVDYDWDYDDVADDGPVDMKGRPDWVGFTDNYWLAALTPQPGTKPDSTFRALGGDNFRADLIYPPVTVA